MKLIDKDVVEEYLNKLYEKHSTSHSMDEGEVVINEIKYFIDTLEVKEVDLEKEINRWQGCEAFPEGVNITPLPKAMDIVERTAKHFFELGMAVRNKAQKGK